MIETRKTLRLRKMKKYTKEELAKYKEDWEVNETHHRGHKAYQGPDDLLRWFDDDNIVWDYPRPCKFCNQFNIVIGGKEIDACFKQKLPGVKYACCGHGESKGYIYFKNGMIVTTAKIITPRTIHHFDDKFVSEYYDKERENKGK